MERKTLYTAGDCSAAGSDCCLKGKVVVLNQDVLERQLYFCLCGNGAGANPAGRAVFLVSLHVKLMLAAGPVLGLAGAASAAVIGLLGMTLYYLGSKPVARLRKREASKRLPLAPFLSVGCIAAYLMVKGGLIV